MPEERTQERIDVSDERLSSLVTPRDTSQMNGGLRFNVSGLKRVRQKFYPIVAVGAAVIVCVVVIFMIVLGK
jgi:hypothetical protein